jgi:hypothetical protein
MNTTDIKKERRRRRNARAKGRIFYNVDESWEDEYNGHKIRKKEEKERKNKRKDILQRGWTLEG